jgi:hypothetical protein
MTPKEKAEDLIDSFIRDGYDIIMSEKLAIRCALISVNEILKETAKRSGINDEIVEYNPYWIQVKHEMQEL